MAAMEAALEASRNPGDEDPVEAAMNAALEFFGDSSESADWFDEMGGLEGVRAKALEYYCECKNGDE